MSIQEKLESLGFETISPTVFVKDSIVHSGHAFRIYDNHANARAGAKNDARLDFGEDYDGFEYFGFIDHIDTEGRFDVILESIKIIVSDEFSLTSNA